MTKADFMPGYEDPGGRCLREHERSEGLQRGEEITNRYQKSSGPLSINQQ